MPTLLSFLCVAYRPLPNPLRKDRDMRGENARQWGTRINVSLYVNNVTVFCSDLRSVFRLQHLQSFELVLWGCWGVEPKKH